MQNEFLGTSPADSDAAVKQIEAYRQEIQLHCYRMMGSFHDAEEMAQETLVRAWRGWEQFEGRSSLRSWLYTIATHTCLNALEKRARRVMPEVLGPPNSPLTSPLPATEIPWLEPYPDAVWEAIIDTAPGPAARYEMRETVSLAFVAAIQHLTPKQRAVLLLCDVLGWSAPEVARFLESSVGSVTSALQRARATLTRLTPHPIHPPQERETLQHQQQDILIQKYIEVWEQGNLEVFASLLKADATMNMPPWSQWFKGREAIRDFIGWAWALPLHEAFRLYPTRANGQIAFGVYARAPGEQLFRPHLLQVLSLSDDEIVSLVFFVNPSLFPLWKLPASLQ